MKKIILRCLLFCMSFLTVFSGLNLAQAKSVENNGIPTGNNLSISTPSDYIKWLEDKSSNELSNKSLDESSSSKVLQQFKALSVLEQQKFVNYLNDENLIRQIIEKLSTNMDKMNYSETLENGDVKITISENLENQNLENSARALPSYYQGYYATSTLFGIDIIKTIHEMTYTVSGTKIGSITHANHGLVHNWHPLVALTWDGLWNRTYGTQAASSKNMTYSFIYQGGLAIGTNKMTVWGNTTGGGRLEVEHL